MGVRHPSIWSFIRVLKDQHSVAEVTIQSIRNGNQPPNQQTKMVTFGAQNKRKKAEYNNGQINLGHYCRAITHLTLNII